MAEEQTTQSSQSLIDLVEEDLFELQCLLRASKIHHSAHCEIGRKQLLAFTTGNADLVLYYQKDISNVPIFKRIPWFQGPHKTISALCFDPSGSWLLTASIDGSLYIIPALALVDESCSIDHRWATNDITSLSPLSSQSSFSRPSALVWWQGVVQCSHIGIIGTEHGEIVLVNLESGKQVGLTYIKGYVSSLHVCQDNSLDIVSLLITNRAKQQWRLILEQRANGYIYPLNGGKSFHSSYPSLNSNTIMNNDAKTFPTTRSRLQGLKQLSVEKLAVLKQKLAETRSRSLTGPLLRQDSSSSSSTDEITSVAPGGHSPNGRVDSLNPDLIPHDMFLMPQYTRQGHHLYTGYHPPTNHLTIHGTDISVVPLYIHKMPRFCEDVLLTQRLFYVTDVHRRSLYIISCPMSETQMGEESEFNSESVIAHFCFDNNKEVINKLYRAADFKTVTTKEAFRDNESKYNTLPKSVDDLKVDVPLVDICIVVTNFAVYKVVLRKPLLSVFMDLVLKRKELEKAGRLALVFGMDVQQLLENAGDILLSNKEFSQAVVLYKLSRCRLLKSVLKFASAGHTSELLSCVTHCLTPPAVTELSTATRIHLSNLSILAFTELSLRVSLQQAKNIHKDFSYFLSTNAFYDELLAVNVAGQTGLWNVLHHLATQRGLYAQVLDILTRTVQSYNSNNSYLSPYQSKYGLLICLSEPNLIQGMITNPNLAKSHMAFVLTSLPFLQIFVLQRLITLYNPTNAVLRPLLVRCKARHRTTSYSSQSSHCDSLDLSEVLEETNDLVEKLIETFLFILLTLIHKKVPALSYNSTLMQRIQLPGIEKDRNDIVTSVDFKRRLLSAGFSHVALLRNGNVFTWGNAAQGCLGIGPTMSRYGPPQPVPFFQSMEIEILSISCGRCHSLAVTNNGVYAWGGSQFGQLGLGKILQCPSPELITTLAQEIIVDAVAGQYHSVALTMDGRIFTWGWGVHGQLGHGNTDEKSIPTLVTALLGTVVRHISAGHAHTMILSAEGYVYVFGSNVFGQLGNGTNVKSSYPTKVTLLPEKISIIATGYFHNLAVSHTNKLYTWGASPQVLRLQAQAQKKYRVLQQHVTTEKRTEQILEESTTHLVERSCEDVDIDDVKVQSVGNDTRNVSSDPSGNIVTNVAEPQDKQTDSTKYCCGRSSSSLKGVNVGMLEEAQTHLRPSLVDTSLVSSKIIQISTGCHHSALLTKDGFVYTWGRNLDGQVGNGSRREITIPTPLSYNPASVLAKVPPRNNGYKLEERRQSADIDNGNSKCDEGNDGGAPDIESAGANEDARKNKINRAIKTVRICCGCDYTIAVQPGGTILAWGGNGMAQLGRPPARDSRGLDDKLVLIKSTKRVVRLPHAAHTALDTPSQVPNIPTPVISYQSYDVTPLAGLIRPLSIVEKSPGELTLHYVLEQFSGLYDSTKVMDKCIELRNYQACSKLALLERNYASALSYQLKTLNVSRLKTHAYSHLPNENLTEIRLCNVMKESVRDAKVLEKSDVQIRHIRENIKLFDEQVEKNFIDTMEECAVKKKIKMSASKSLDSFQMLEQELHTFDCQGGSEELCEDSKSEDISLDITEGALDNESEVDNQSESVGNVVFGNDVSANLKINTNSDVEVCVNSLTCSKDICRVPVVKSEIRCNDKNVFEDNETGNQENNVVHEAASMIKFYTNEIEEDSHATMREVLQSALKFWIQHNLPMQDLENVFLEHINKLFYPLGLLLFCQNNIDDNIDANENNTEDTSLMTINSLSTKFCLRVCSMLLRHIDQGKSTPEYIELLSQLTAKHYGPPLTGHPGSSGNKTPEQMMEGVISTIPSDNCDPKPFIHIKDPDKVSRFLAENENTIVFTCGHHFPISTYQSEIIPRMEAELLMSQPFSLPCTAQLLEDVLCRPYKIETLCPLCIPPVLQTIARNVADS